MLHFQQKYGPPSHIKPRPYSIMLELLETQANKKLISEYTADVTKTLAHLESISQVNPAMIELQPEIQWFMRPFLLDFLIELHSSFKLQPQTLFLCLNIIDRYCAKRIVFKRHYQLVGCTALWIAGKYEDKKSRIPTLKELTIMCRNAYDEEMFIQMEMHILSTLEWSLSHPNLEECLQLAISHSNIATTTPCKYNNPASSSSSSSSSISAITVVGRFLCELSLYDNFFLGMPTSLVAITANLLACSMLQIPNAVNALKQLLHESERQSPAKISGTLYNNANKSNYLHKIQNIRHDSFADLNSDNEFLDFDSEDESDGESDESDENKQPLVYGAFLSGLDRSTIQSIKKIALMFIIQLSKVTEVLSKKYESLGVIQVINNFHSRYTYIIQTIYEHQETIVSNQEASSLDNKLVQLAEILLQFPRMETISPNPNQPHQTPFSSALSLNTHDLCLPPPQTPPSASSQYSVFSNKRSSSVCVTPIHAHPGTAPSSNVTSSGGSILRSKPLRVTKYGNKLNINGSSSSLINRGNGTISPSGEASWTSPIMHV